MSPRMRFACISREVLNIGLDTRPVACVAHAVARFYPYAPGVSSAVGSQHLNFGGKS